MSHREEASGKTQDTLERLCLSAGLGTPRGPPGRAGGSVWGQNIAFPTVALWVTVGLAVCLLVLLIALAAVCRRKIKESCEEARREAEEAKELEEEESKAGQPIRTWSSLSLHMHQGPAVCFCRHWLRGRSWQMPRDLCSQELGQPSHNQ
ncbi:hypothetical protein L3Q82_000255 [Scortum barcoo]|uniref:Uncharacterized protein n=1 Tax=Scortum barcoo TaxID=214431 RepID=A0ACB8XAI7_9TELE|nr:hypothetical protein L3Q82_000255 [Scortum barcoo]